MNVNYMKLNPILEYLFKSPLSISTIEKEADLPATTLNQVKKGKRGLSDKQLWSLAKVLSKYGLETNSLKWMYNSQTNEFSLLNSEFRVLKMICEEELTEALGLFSPCENETAYKYATELIKLHTTAIKFLQHWEDYEDFPQEAKDLLNVLELCSSLLGRTDIVVKNPIEFLSNGK